MASSRLHHSPAATHYAGAGVVLSADGDWGSVVTMPHQWPRSFVKDCLIIGHPDQVMPAFAVDENDAITVYLQDMAIIPMEQYEALMSKLPKLPDTYTSADLTAMSATNPFMRAIASPDPMPRAREPNEMVERVARAICSSVGKDPDAPFKDHFGRAMDFPEWHRWQGEARAAIAAMREPTQAMLDVADSFGDYGREPWPEMIDAALDAPQDG